MIGTSERLRYLLKSDSFAICPLMTPREFVTFCEKRGIKTKEEQLERLEKLGVLYPVARVKWPRVTHKIEFIDDGRRYRDHGILQPGEAWNGDTREEWGRWVMGPSDADELLDEGHMWDPRAREFQPWTSYRDGHDTRTETFYTMFQCFPLEWKLMSLTSRYDVSVLVDGGDAAKISEQLQRYGKQMVESLQQATREDDIAFVAQALSAAYYPRTRTDRRTFTLRSPRFDWDWYDFIASWNPKRVAEDLELSEEEISRQQQRLAMLSQSRDPLERWYQLIRFISVSKKDQLKGSAQYAQLLYSMEYMVRLFAKDAFDLELHPPDEGPTWRNEDLYGEGVPEDPLKHLEFVVNDYHLNPRPKLILVVEGQSEEVAFPLLAEKALGHSLTVLGVEIRTLGGVGEYTGSRRRDRYGALEKFIDDYHYRQTVVFIILDREGRVEEVTRRLCDATSRLYPARKLTCPDYIRLWDRTVEFDNFTHEEIAEALTDQADGSYTFSPAEIGVGQDEYDRGVGDPLSQLFRKKVGRSLNKVECLKFLSASLATKVEGMVDSKRAKERPILRLLDDVINLAALNHQPVTQDTWEQNQESGYFGKPVA